MASLRSFVAHVVAIALLAAMMLTTSVAAGRAASHVGGQLAQDMAVTMPPCHQAAMADHLAPRTASPCDTLCAGSAPEFSAERPPHPLALAAAQTIDLTADAFSAPQRAQSVAVFIRGRAPPLRSQGFEQRLLI